MERWRFFMDMDTFNYTDTNEEFDDRNVNLFGPSYIRFLNANLELKNVNVTVNGQLVAQNIRFSDITEYVRVRAGNVTVRVYLATNPTRPILTKRILIMPFSITTVAIIRKEQENELLTINDPNMPPLSDVNRFRVINLLMEPTTIHVDLASGRRLFRNVKSEEVTRYITMEPGRYRILVKEANRDKTILIVPNVVLRQRKNISMYVIGSTVEKDTLKVVLPLDGNSYLFDEQI